MAVSDEIRRTLSDAKPLYALAGAGDFAAEKLRDAPILLSEMAGTVTTLATRLATEAPERLAKVQARIAEVPGALDPRGARESIRGAVGKADAQVLRERAQSIALSQVGRVLEAAGKAVETYDGLAERGKTVLDKYLGSNDPEPSDVTVVVEQVVVDEPEAEKSPSEQPKPGAAESKIDDAVLTEPADEPIAEPVKPKAAKKTTSSTPRKRATAPKGTTKSTNSDTKA
jgi:hypothetical protein